VGRGACVTTGRCRYLALSTFKKHRAGHPSDVFSTAGGAPALGGHGAGLLPLALPLRVLHGPGPPGAVRRPSHFIAFPTVNRFSVAVLHRRAGGVTAENGGFWPGQFFRGSYGLLFMTACYLVVLHLIFTATVRAT
jgi:hypothetical protein